MFQMMGVFAEFEQAIIQERVRAGLRRAGARESSWADPRSMSTSNARSSPICAEKIAQECA